MLVDQRMQENQNFMRKLITFLFTQSRVAGYRACVYQMYNELTSKPFMP